MNCNEVKELISEYIDKQLDSKMNAEFEEHIRTCEDCRKELNEMKSMLDLLKDLPSEELPKDFKINLHNRLLEEQAKQKKKMKFNIFANRYARVCTSIAAGIALIILLRGFTGEIFNPLGRTKSNSGEVIIESLNGEQPADNAMLLKAQKDENADSLSVQSYLESDSYATQGTDGTGLGSDDFSGYKDSAKKNDQQEIAMMFATTVPEECNEVGIASESDSQSELKMASSEFVDNDDCGNESQARISGMPQPSEEEENSISWSCSRAEPDYKEKRNELLNAVDNKITLIVHAESENTAFETIKRYALENNAVIEAETMDSDTENNEVDDSLYMKITINGDNYGNFVESIESSARKLSIDYEPVNDGTLAGKLHTLYLRVDCINSMLDKIQNSESPNAEEVDRLRNEKEEVLTEINDIISDIGNVEVSVYIN